MKGNESSPSALPAFAAAAARASRVLVVAVVLLTVACTGGSDEPLAVEPTVDVVEPTASNGAADTDANDPDVSPVADPTSTPSSAADADRVDAAIAALDANGVGELIAWDVLDSSVDDDGIVTLTLCGWTGDTVFDGVYRSLWTTGLSSGMLVASELGTSPTAGECLNTELIDSALETRRQFEAYWADVLNDPSTFTSDERGRALLTDRYRELAATATTQWIADGVTFKGLSFDAVSEVAPTSWRRFQLPEDQRLELASCRAMSDDYGIYVNNVQADGFPPDPPTGIHSIDSVILVPSASSETLWRVRFVDNLSWADCTRDPGWPTTASEWRDAPTDFAPLIEQ